MCRSFIRQVSLRTNLVNPLRSGLESAGHSLAPQDSFIDGAQFQAYALTPQPKCRESATRKQAVFPAAP